MFLSSSLRMPGLYAPSSLAKFGEFVKNVNELIDFVKIPCRFKINTLSLRRFSEKTWILHWKCHLGTNINTRYEITNI
jgi:hypothetical protein